MSRIEKEKKKSLFLLASVYSPCCKPILTFKNSELLCSRFHHFFFFFGCSIAGDLFVRPLHLFQSLQLKVGQRAARLDVVLVEVIISLVPLIDREGAGPAECGGMQHLDHQSTARHHGKRE